MNTIFDTNLKQGVRTMSNDKIADLNGLKTVLDLPWANSIVIDLEKYFDEIDTMYNEFLLHKQDDGYPYFKVFNRITQIQKTLLKRLERNMEYKTITDVQILLSDAKQYRSYIFGFILGHELTIAYNTLRFKDLMRFFTKITSNFSLKDIPYFKKLDLGNKQEKQEWIKAAIVLIPKFFCQIPLELQEFIHSISLYQSYFVFYTMYHKYTAIINISDELKNNPTINITIDNIIDIYRVYLDIKAKYRR